VPKIPFSYSIRFPGSARRLLPFAFAAVSLIGLGLTSCRPPALKPVQVGKLPSSPLSIRYQDGAWFWLEQPPNASMHLICFRDTQPQRIASAQEIRSYTVEQGKIAWAARHGRQWTVFLTEEKGGEPRTLWSGTDEPMGLNLSGGRLYWLHRLPAPVADSGPLPSLSPSLEVVAAPVEGGAPAPVTRLWESGDGEVLGMHDGALYVALYRTLRPGSFHVVRIPSGGAPARLVSEQGHPYPILTKKGALYWTAPSPEVSDSMGLSCLRRLDRAGRIETLTDWLPPNGRVYETARGVLYADGDMPSSLWRFLGQDRFPEAIPVPRGYAALAAGGEDALLIDIYAALRTPTLYKMPLP
jgi:hypothetical protein